MQIITRTIVRRFWGLTAFLVICLAVLVVVGRELTPQISRYKQDVVSSLSESLGVKVAIKDMSATWEGLSPELRLSDVVFTSQKDENILSIGSATAKLSLLRSLFNWQLAWGNIELAQVDMGFTQNKNRSWSLIGLPETTTSRENINIDDPIDIFLLGRHIELRQANLSFQFRTGHLSKVKLPYALMENSGDFHRFSSEIGVDGNTDVMKMVLEGQGDPRDLDSFSAKGYARLQQFELERAMAMLPGELWEGLPEKEWREGHQLNLEVWVDIFPGMKVVSSGRVDVGELPVSLEKDFPFPKKTGANFSSLWDETGAWSISVRNLTFDWDNVQSMSSDIVMSSIGLGKPINIQMESINVDAWMATLNEAGYFRGKLKEALDTLSPTGVVNNVLLSIEGTKLEDVSLKANLSNVSVGAWNGAPELKKINGYLEATPLSGFIDLDSRDGFSMFYPKIYKERMDFDSANGRVHWTIDLEKKAVNVHSGLLAVNGEEGQGRGYFSLFVPFKFGEQQEELIIQVGLRDSVVGYHKKFVPFVAPTSLLDWMDESIQEGRVNSGGFIYRGGFTEGSIKNTALQLYVDVEGASLNYHADWPAITSAKGEIWLDDDTVTATVESAKFLGTTAKNTHIAVSPSSTAQTAITENTVTQSTVNQSTVTQKTVNQKNGIHLSISGSLSGKASSGLRIINETPIQSIVGSQFKNWQLTGDMDASVALEIPLQFENKNQIEIEAKTKTETENNAQIFNSDHDNIASTNSNALNKKTSSKMHSLGRQHIEVSFSKAALTIPEADLKFKKLKGQLIYDDRKGLTSEKITGTLWGRKASAVISKTINKKTGSDILFVDVQGEATVKSIKEWVDLPILDFFSGESAFKVGVSLPYMESEIDKTELTISSALQGVTVDLPAPFGKSKNAAGTLNVTLPLKINSGNNSQALFNYQVEYNDIFHGIFNVDGKKLKSAAINLSASSSNPPKKPRISEGKVVVKGKMSEFDYDIWLTTFQRYLNAEKARNVIGETENPSTKIASNSFKPTANIVFDSFTMSGFVIDDMHLNAYWSDGAWMLNTKSEIVTGDFVIFDDVNKPLVANLMHLHILTKDYDPSPRNPFLPLPEATSIGDSLAEWNPKDLPAVEFSVSDLTLNKESYGSWSFDVEPTSTGVQLNNITGEIRGGYVIGNENETGATLLWDIDENQQMQTQFSGRFVSDKFEDVLRLWGQPELLESEAAKFDAELFWIGSPAAVSTIALDGNIKLLIEKGSFYQDENNPSAGGAFLQLISFFNFDTWVRRLRLDFSDLTRKGMAFDQVEGTLFFEHGDVLMKTPLVVKTPSGRFQAVGNIDLIEEKVDATLIATLPVGGNLTLFTALAAGLPAAVGVYIISKIFEKQVDKVASVRYSVKGKLSDPDFEFDKLFGDKIEAEKTEADKSEERKIDTISAEQALK